MKEVVLQFKSSPHSWVRNLMKYQPLQVKILDCRPIPSENGVQELFEISTLSDNLKEVVEELKKIKDIHDLEILTEDYKKGKVVGTLKTDHCNICRIFSGPECFLGSAVYMLEDGIVKWTMLINDDLIKILLKKLEENDIDAQIEEISSVGLKEPLTAKQEQITKLALKMGYFDHPRKINLRKLSKIFGVSPPALSEVLRRGLKKILTEYFKEEDTFQSKYRKKSKD
jgi:hypothetical protein